METLLEVKVPEGIVINVASLLQEAGRTPMDLTSFGIAQATAYRLAHGEGSAITFEVLRQLCDYFSERLGRPVGPGDILLYTSIRQ